MNKESLNWWVTTISSSEDWTIDHKLKLLEILEDAYGSSPHIEEAREQLIVEETLLID